MFFLFLFRISLLGCGDYTVGRNTFGSSCCIWSLLCVLCWLMAPSPVIRGSCVPCALIQSLGSINLVLLLVLISKVFHFPLNRIVAWQGRESSQWTSDLPTLHYNGILGLKEIFSVFKFSHLSNLIN